MELLPLNQKSNPIGEFGKSIHPYKTENNKDTQCHMVDAKLSRMDLTGHTVPLNRQCG